MSLKNDDLSFEFYLKGLRILDEHMGDRATKAATLNNLGKAFFLKKEYELSKSYYKRSLDMYIACSGEEHPDTALGWGGVGIA